MTAPQAVIHVGAKPKANKKLFIVLGAVLLLVIVMRIAPAVLGGGSGAVKAFHPSSVFHVHKAATASSGSGSAPPLVRSSRDPFAAPAGVVPPPH